MLNIKLLEASEVPAYCALVQDTIRTSPYYKSQAIAEEAAKYSLLELQKMVVDPQYICLIAMDADVIVGFAFGEYDSGTFLLHWYGVQKSFRRQGIAAKLLGELAEKIKVTFPDVVKIWCDTRAANVESVGLLTKLGYRRVAELKNHWYGEDYFLWEKLIA